MPDASTQTTKGKNIFLLPKKFVKVEEWEKQICWNCNDCPATHRTYRDDLDGYEFLCDECHKDEYPEEYEDEEDEMKEICIFEAWDRKYGANVAEKDKETEFQKKRHLFSDAYDKQEEEEDVCCVGCGDRVCGFHEEPDHKDDRDEAVCNDCYECIEEEVIYYFLKDNELTQTDTPFNPKIHEWETLLEVDGRIEKTYKLKGTDEGGNCDEEEEGVFTCECCGTEDIDDVDGLDCPRCDFAVCDECMVCDENDGNCKTDRCKKCDEEEGINITDLVVSVLQGEFACEEKKKKIFVIDSA